MCSKPMSQATTEWNLWKSIRITFLLQRIYCVSPFYLDRSQNKLKVSIFTRMYTFFVLSIIVSLIWISVFDWNVFQTILYLLPHGYLWMILTIYELLSINFQFILNILIINSNKFMQIELLHRIFHIDQQLYAEFGASIDFKKNHQHAVCALIVFNVYYYGLMIVACYWSYINDKYALILFICIFQFEQLALAIMTLSCANYIFLIRARLQLLRQIYRKFEYNFMRQPHAEVKGVYKQNILHQLRTIFEVFKELCNLIQMMGRFSGWNGVLILVHDFTWSLIQGYFLFYILLDDQEKHFIIYAAVVIASLLGNFAQTFTFAAAVAMTTSQVGTQ